MLNKQVREKGWCACACVCVWGEGEGAGCVCVCGGGGGVVRGQRRYGSDVSSNALQKYTT